MLVYILADNNSKALVVATALHLIFPVAAQSDYVASVTTYQAREELEEYIERLELDFSTIHGEVRLPGVHEKVSEVSCKYELGKNEDFATKLAVDS